MLRYVGVMRLSMQLMALKMSMLHTQPCNNWRLLTGQSQMHFSKWVKEGLSIVTASIPKQKHGMLDMYIHLTCIWKKNGRAKFVCWVMENNQPFQIVNDCGFRSLMKTGRPEYYIPSAETLSCDVKNMFVCVHGHIAKALKVSLMLPCDDLRTHLIQ